MGKSSAPITDRKYLVPFVLVTTLFFLWALGVNLNDILIPHLKKTFNLTDFQSSLIQTAFFGGYFLAALPAGWIMERIGYRRGILIGLGTCALGALLFIPAASIRVYGFFLFALFVMACGQGMLEVAANPYVTILGPPESSERRLNLSQSFNAVGAWVTPFIGRAFILSGIEYSAATVTAMTPQQWQAYSASEASRVRGTYFVIAGIFLFVAILIYFVRLPEVRESSGEALPAPEAAPQTHKGIWHHKHLIRGVITEFFYVGAQVGVTSFVIRFTQHALPGTPEKTAADYLKWHLFGFMIGRFVGSAIMKRVAPPKLLGLFSVAAAACTIVAIFMLGTAAVWAVVLLGFFDSIMFPTIFALSIKNLGAYTKLGSSLLVMSIIGGAIVPAVMGYISDRSSIQAAFAVPFFCYAVVMYFSFSGYKLALVPAQD
ncbi:MAG: L-fucose:H+ symporter permease [Candidatus Acidiferrales bacterium]